MTPASPLDVAVRPTVTTYTTTVNALHDLIDPVLVLADKGQSLPILATVHLRGHGDWITATATDRYRIGIKRAKADIPADFAASVGVDVWRTLFRIFKATRIHDPELTFTFREHDFDVTQGGGSDLITGATVTFPLTLGEYPKMAATWETFTRKGATEGAVNPHFLADFRHACSASGEPMTAWYASHPSGHPMLCVAIGDDFRGILMSVSQDPQPAVWGDEWTALTADIKAPA